MTRSPQPAPPMHLRHGSHTTHTPSTAFRGPPVGALENHGHISPSVHLFSNSPDSHSHDLENSHLSQPRAPTLFHPDSHFSYLTYGYYCFLFIYIHTYPPSFVTGRWLEVPGCPIPVPSPLVPFPHSPVFQRTTLVFHAPFLRDMATIGVSDRRRFRLPASCCTVRA